MGIGKPGVPSAPEYSAGASGLPTDFNTVATSEANVGSTGAATSGNMLNWATQSYANQLPVTSNFISNMENYGNQAAGMQASSYFPVQQQFVNTAMNYNSPAQQAQASAEAQADVANAYAGQREGALQSLESYGIDPSQTRFSALDLGTRITQAANMASAGTQARLASQQTGLNLQQAAAQMGFTQAGLQQSTGQAGVQAGLNTMTTGANIMGTPIQWGQLGLSGLEGAGNTISQSYQDQLSAYQLQNQNNANTSQGIGSAIGAIAALAFSDRRLKTDIHRIGKTDAGIPIVTFRFKGEPKGIQPHVGVIAQDVEKKIPAAVVQNVGGTGFKGVDYRRLV